MATRCVHAQGKRHTDYGAGMISNLDAARAAYGRWIKSEGAAVFEEIVRLLLDRVPMLQGADDAEQRLRASVTSHLPAFEAFAQVEVPDRWRLPTPAREFAIAHAERGTALESILMSYEIGKVEIWRAFVRAVREEGPYRIPAETHIDALELVFERASAYNQSITTQVVEAYTARTAQNDRRLTARRLEAVQALLNGSSSVDDAEKALDYSISDGAHVAFVASVSDGVPDTRLDAAISHVASMLGGTYLAVPAGSRSAVVWVRVRAGSWTAFGSSLTTRPPEGCVIALGTEQAGIAGFRQTRNEAIETARVMALLGKAQVMCFADVEAEALATRDLDGARALVDRQLRPVIARENLSADLIATVRCFLETGGSPTRSARELHLHPNTVVQRLKRFETLRSRPTEVGDLSLWLALRLEPTVRKD